MLAEKETHSHSVRRQTSHRVFAKVPLVVVRYTVNPEHRQDEEGEQKGEDLKAHCQKNYQSWTKVVVTLGEVLVGMVEDLVSHCAALGVGWRRNKRRMIPAGVVPV